MYLWLLGYNKSINKNIFYSIFIFINLICIPLYDLCTVSDKKMVPLYILKFGGILQYIIGQYIFTDIFFIKYYIDYSKLINYISICISIINLLIITLCNIFNNYNYVYIIFNSIHIFYNIQIVSLNIIILYVILIVNIGEIRLLEFNVYSEILHEIINIKYILSTAINKLDYIFNILTIHGIIVFTFILLQYNEYSNKIYIFILLIVYIFIELFSYLLIVILNNLKNNLICKIHSPKFFEIFLQRYNNFTLKELVKIDSSNILYNDSEKNIINNIESNAKSIDWLLLDRILHYNWIEFTFCGFNIHNLDFIKQYIFIITIYFIYIY